jgi:hypothetical protein
VVAYYDLMAEFNIKVGHIDSAQPVAVTVKLPANAAVQRPSLHMHLKLRPNLWNTLIYASPLQVPEMQHAAYHTMDNDYSSLRDAMWNGEQFVPHGASYL